MVTPYYSCEWLERGLTFAPDGLYACCVMHHTHYGWPKICDFKGGVLPFKKIREIRSKITKLNQTQQFEDCRQCLFLKKNFWNKSDYLVDVINLSHSTFCNLKCSYCYLQISKAGDHWWENAEVLESGQKPYKLIPTFESMIQEGFLSPSAVINWGGGEPLLLEEFDALFSLVSEYGARNSIATNGTLYSDVLAQGLRLGQADIVCSVDAGTAKTYLDIKQRDYYEQVWANLAAYSKFGNVVAKFIFVPRNSSKKEIIAFVRRAHAAGIKNIICDIDAFGTKVEKKIAPLISLARNEVIKYGMNLSVGGCGAASFPEMDVESESKDAEFFHLKIKKKFKYAKESIKIKLFGTLELQGGNKNPEWLSGLKNEAYFWERWLAEKGLEWPDDFIFRCSRETDLQNYIIELLSHKEPGSEVRILDAGAGPLTGLGKCWLGRTVSIESIDISADLFDVFLHRHGIVSPVKTVFGEMEELSKLFQANSFDMVYASNSLHCTYSPVTALCEMIRVVKPQGTVMLTQSQNEGQRKNYKGLYQWNVFSEKGDLMLGNAERSVNITTLLSEQAEITCRVESGWVNAFMKKRLPVC